MKKKLFPRTEKKFKFLHSYLTFCQIYKFSTFLAFLVSKKPFYQFFEEEWELQFSFIWVGKGIIFEK